MAAVSRTGRSTRDERLSSRTARARGRTARPRRRRVPLVAVAPPERIALAAVGEEWAVEYRIAERMGIAVTERGARDRRAAAELGDPEAVVPTLFVAGSDPRAPEPARAALRRWLRRRARAEFEPHLGELAAFHGLPAPEGVRIGFPWTRWASCSARRTVSVNARLLFLPPELVRHVLMHELCHLVHLNHSAQFYALLQAHDPDHERARAALRQGASFVPEWVDGRLPDAS